MHIRTMREVYKHIKTADPDTDLTYYALRRMILTGVIPSVKSGRKYLIDIDNLEKYLVPGVTRDQQDIPKYGSIRRIAE